MSGGRWDLGQGAMLVMAAHPGHAKRRSQGGLRWATRPTEKRCVPGPRRSIAGELCRAGLKCQRPRYEERERKKVTNGTRRTARWHKKEREARAPSGGQRDMGAQPTGSHGSQALAVQRIVKNPPMGAQVAVCRRSGAGLRPPPPMQRSFGGGVSLIHRL